jgi:hypothetical protein
MIQHQRKIEQATAHPKQGGCGAQQPPESQNRYGNSKYCGTVWTNSDPGKQDGERPSSGSGDVIKNYWERKSGKPLGASDIRYSDTSSLHDGFVQSMGQLTLRVFDDTYSTAPKSVKIKDNLRSQARAS